MSFTWSKAMRQCQNEKRSQREKWKRKYPIGTTVIWTGPTGIKHQTKIASSPWYQYSDLFVNIEGAYAPMAVRCDALVKKADQ